MSAKDEVNISCIGMFDCVALGNDCFIIRILLDLSLVFPVVLMFMFIASPLSPHPISSISACLRFLVFITLPLSSCSISSISFLSPNFFLFSIFLLSAYFLSVSKFQCFQMDMTHKSRSGSGEYRMTWVLKLLPIII